MREKRTKYEGRRGTEHEGLIPVTDIVQDLTSVNIDPMVSLRSPDIQPLRCGDLRRYPLFNTEWTSRVNCRAHVTGDEFGSFMIQTWTSSAPAHITIPSSETPPTVTHQTKQT